jgi:hypothetical protein
MCFNLLLNCRKQNAFIYFDKTFIVRSTHNIIFFYINSYYNNSTKYTVQWYTFQVDRVSLKKPTIQCTEHAPTIQCTSCSQLFSVHHAPNYAVYIMLQLFSVYHAPTIQCTEDAPTIQCTSCSQLFSVQKML